MPALTVESVDENGLRERRRERITITDYESGDENGSRERITRTATRLRVLRRGMRERITRTDYDNGDRERITRRRDLNLRIEH